MSLTPSNYSARPNLPVVVRVAPEIVPGLPRPEASAAVVPVVSSKPQAPTRPVGGVQAGAGDGRSVTATVFGEPETPAAVIVTVAGVGARRQARRVDGATDTVPGACRGRADAQPRHVVGRGERSVPPPALVTLTVCAAGWPRPAVAVNASAAGATASAGGGGGSR